MGEPGLPVEPPDSSTEQRRTLAVVSTVEQPEEPTVRVYPPDEALERARPLPPRDRLVVEDIPNEEWKAFQEALAEA
jgi:hypothetical protein